MAIDVSSLVNNLGINLGSHVDTTAGGYSSNLGAKPAPAPTGIGAFLGNLGKSTASAVGGAGNWIAHQALDGPVGLYNDTTNNLGLGQRQNQQAQTEAQLQARQDKLISSYKTGAIDKNTYQQGLRSLTSDSQKAHASQVQLTNDTQNNYADAGQVAGHAAQTAATAATLLAPELTAGASVLGKAVPLVGKVIKPLEDVIGVGKTLGTGNGLVGAATSLPGKLVRNAVVTQPTVQLPADTVHNATTGNYGGLALDAAALAGGPLAKGIGKAGTALKDATFGKQGVLDTAFGGDRLAAHVATNPQDVQGLKRMEMFTQNQPAVKSGNVQPGDFLKSHLASIGVDSTQQPIGTSLSNFNHYAKQVSALESAKAAGGIPEHAVVSADFTKAIPAVAKELGAVGDLSQTSAVDRVALANRVIDRLGITNPTIKSQIGGAITSAVDGKSAAKELKPIIQKNIITTPAGTLDKGFIATHGPIDRAAMPALKDVTGELTMGKKQSPALAWAGNGLTKIGASPLPSNSVATAGKFSENFNTAIDKNPALAGRGQEILSAIKDRAGTTGVADIKLMSKRNIGIALSKLNIGDGQTKAIRSAMDTAASQLSFADRGAAGKLTDAMTKNIPLDRQYMRAQQIGRFGRLNPFFQSKVAIKGEALAQAASGGHNPFGNPSSDVKAYVTNQFKGTLDSAVNDAAVGVPNVKPGIIGKALQNSAGNMMEQMLKNQKVTLAQLDKNPALQHEINHSIETVFGYPKGGFLDSNFAKAMNVALFPFRFEAKVATATGKFLVKQDPLTRVALVNGIAGAHTFLSSPQGQDWAHKNSELVGAAKYFTPAGTVGELISALKGNGVNAQDLGLIGGLPLGVISTVLAGQGVHAGPFGASPYRDPKSGLLKPEQIPKNDATRIKQGISDIVGSMFSYPGATLGLTRKSQVIQDVVPGIHTTASDFNKVGGDSAPSSTTPPIRKETQYLDKSPVTNNSKIPLPTAKSAKLPRVKNHAFTPRHL